MQNNLAKIEHKNIATTEIYAKITQSHLDQKISDWNKSFWNTAEEKQSDARPHRERKKPPFKKDSSLSIPDRPAPPVFGGALTENHSSNYLGEFSIGTVYGLGLRWNWRDNSNNCAEKTFRLPKTHIKVFGTFGTREGEEDFTARFSDLQTCRLCKVNRFEAIKRAFP